jgi:hypothetical protein
MDKQDIRTCTAVHKVVKVFKETLEGRALFFAIHLSWLGTYGRKDFNNIDVDETGHLAIDWVFQCNCNAHAVGYGSNCSISHQKLYVIIVVVSTGIHVVRDGFVEGKLQIRT